MSQDGQTLVTSIIQPNLNFKNSKKVMKIDDCLYYMVIKEKQIDLIKYDLVVATVESTIEIENWSDKVQGTEE